MPFSRKESQTLLENYLHGITVKAWSPFEEVYLFRVEYPSEIEKDWDPFFSVDPATGDVRDFSVTTDIPPREFLRLKWAEV